MSSSLSAVKAQHFCAKCAKIWPQKRHPPIVFLHFSALFRSAGQRRRVQNSCTRGNTFPPICARRTLLRPELLCSRKYFSSDLCLANDAAPRTPVPEEILFPRAVPGKRCCVQNLPAAYIHHQSERSRELSFVIVPAARAGTFRFAHRSYQKISDNVSAKLIKYYCTAGRIPSQAILP